MGSSLRNGGLRVAVLFVAGMVISLMSTGVVWADETTLPPKEWFVPETSSVPAEPFLWAINWLVGFAAMLLLGWAVFKLLLVVKDLIGGKESLDSKKSYFIGLGVGMMILMMALTGTWYSVLLWVWNKGLTPIIERFQG